MGRDIVAIHTHPEMLADSSKPKVDQGIEIKMSRKVKSWAIDPTMYPCTLSIWLGFSGFSDSKSLRIADRMTIRGHFQLQTVKLPEGIPPSRMNH